MTPRFASVALPIAIHEALTYAVPEDLQGMLHVGSRVLVPLKGRKMAGFVVALADRAPIEAARLRYIERVDPEEPLLERPLMDLVEWVAEYYAAPLGQVCESAVPRSVVKKPKGVTAGSRVPQEWGNAEIPQLTTHQARAVSEVIESLRSPKARTFLLEGVTGSGKTEVYLRAAEWVLERGGSVLFLVPEIALGSLLLQRVRMRFGDAVGEYHSQMKATERRETWWLAKGGRVRVVVGARSAVFVPMRDLRLVVVDEEHEPAYKQSETPRYHGRDVALMRARLEGAVTLLGSATPSLESRYNVERGKFALLELPERVESKPRPTVTLVDLRASNTTAELGTTPAGIRKVAAGATSGDEPLSPYLLSRLRETIAAGNQAIVFMNRRGFSTAVQCRDCGHVFECPKCSVALTYHKAARRLRCHYCNYGMDAPSSCPTCGGTHFVLGGVGTQRIEAALQRHLPEARVLRVDLDSTRRRGASIDMLARFGRGEADILLGTQMIAKGLDFQRVTLVGVVSADSEMALPDFRSQERAFQLLTQVAGRAGRGAAAGEVVFQTFMPQHHVIETAALQDYERFYAAELEERRLLGYPPFRRMVNILIDGPDETAVIRHAEEMATILQDERGIEILGPAPMPLSRLKGKYRWHVTLLSSSPKTLAEVLRRRVLRAERRSGIRVQVDVDPASML